MIIEENTLQRLQLSTWYKKCIKKLDKNEKVVVTILFDVTRSFYSINPNFVFKNIGRLRIKESLNKCIKYILTARNKKRNPARGCPRSSKVLTIHKRLTRIYYM